MIASVSGALTTVFVTIVIIAAAAVAIWQKMTGGGPTHWNTATMTAPPL
jgi:hypothetical protein